MKHVIKTGAQLKRVQDEIGRQLETHRERGLLVTVDIYRPPKTGPQMGKLHMMIAELAEHLGYGFDELKAEIKQQYGPRRESVLNGGDSIPKSWRDLSREEAGALIERVYQIGAECGCQFREPGHG